MLIDLVRMQLTVLARRAWVWAVFVPTLLLSVGLAVLQVEEWTERKQASLILRSRDMNVAQVPIVFEPEPLSILAHGLDVQAGTSHKINPLATLFVSLDFVRLVQLFLSLQAILAGAATLSQEKENGTLLLQLAQGANRHDLVISNWVSGFVSLALSTTVICIPFLLLGASQGVLSLSVRELGKTVVVLFLSILYLAVFFGAGVLISALTLETKRASVAALVVWVLAQFLVPSLGYMSAGVLTPLPTDESLLQKRLSVRAELRLARDRGLISSKDYSEQAAQEEHRIDEGHLMQIERFLSTASDLTRCSPAASYVYAATDLAGTGIQAWIAKRTLLLSRRGTPERIAMYSETTFAESLAAAGFDASLLLFYALAVLILACAVFSRAAVQCQ